jgi:O-antigen ligase
MVAALVIFSHPAAVIAARRALVIAVLLAVALNVFEAFEPGLFSGISGRSGGFYVNPNRSALALVLGTALCIDVVPARLRSAFFLATTLGMILTFSRAGFLCHAALTAALLIRRRLSVLRTVVIIATVAVAAGLAVGFDRFANAVASSDILNENTEARLRFDVNDASSAERQVVLRKAASMFIDAPLVGNGIGASVLWDASASSHNVFANMAVDHGIVGLAVAILLIVALAWRSGAGPLFAIIVGVFGMFSHNILEERYALLSYALAAMLPRSGGSEYAAPGDPTHADPSRGAAQ